MRRIGHPVRVNGALDALEQLVVLEHGSGHLVIGSAKERADALGVASAHISLTHGRDVAAAVVVLEAL